MLWIARCVATRSGFGQDGKPFHTATLTGRDPDVVITITSGDELPHHIDSEYVLELDYLKETL